MNFLRTVIPAYARMTCQLRTNYQQAVGSYGFSLLEVVLALALFGMVVLGVLEFFPQAYRLESQSQQATHSIFIAEGILNILKATAPQGVLATGPDWKNSSSDVLFFSLTSSSTYFVAYDNSDQPRRIVALEEYNKPFHEEGVSSLASIIVTPQKDSPGLSQVDITIATPANVAEKERHHLEFSLLLSTLSPHESIAE